MKAAAERHGIDATDDVTALAGARLDLGVVVAYGAMVPATVLDELVLVNLHFSFLPRWRGAAPVERAILAGDERTGVSLMALEPTLDTGPVYASASTEVDDKDLDALRGELVELGTSLLVAMLAGGLDGLGTPVAQPGEATYAKKVLDGDSSSTSPDPRARWRGWSASAAHARGRTRRGSVCAPATSSTRTRGRRGAARRRRRVRRGRAAPPHGGPGGATADAVRGLAPRAPGPAPHAARRAGGTRRLERWPGGLTRHVGTLQIAPSILSADFGDLAAARCEAVDAAHRPAAHRRDGRPLRAQPHLGPPSWPRSGAARRASSTATSMLTDPGDYLEAFA